MYQDIITKTDRPTPSKMDHIGIPRTNRSSLTNLLFQPNPGNLGAKIFIPSTRRLRMPLVVVLHGCTQTPEAYDLGTGWTDLAERYGFAVLYPEQRFWNNMNGCFNWFEPGDMQRGAGEPASIKSMIDQIAANYSLDAGAIFITGLSAGAAMAGVMIASYPEMFAGGGFIAGVPYGVARSALAAVRQMRSRGGETDRELAGLVFSASEHTGPWPTVSIWHGTKDTTVDASNGYATVGQWRAVHGLDDANTDQELVDGHLHRSWHDVTGRTCVEEYVIAGMGHGAPLDARNPSNVERAGAFLIDVGLSSTERLAASWGLNSPPAMAA